MPIFAGMLRRDSTVDPALERLFNARSLDGMVRRSVRRYLKRTRMSRSGFGRAALNDSMFMYERFGWGRTLRLKTADRIQVFIGEPPLRPLIEGEVEAFLAVTGLKPWVVGYQAVNSTSFVWRLRRGGSPWLSTVDRVRAWMRMQTSEEQRRSILYAVAEQLAGSPDWPGPRKGPMRGETKGGERMSIETVLLTTKEAAAVLGVCTRTLERWRVTGEGPRFRKIGHWVRYAPSDLDEWLKKCTRESTSDDGSNARTKGRKRGKGRRRDKGRRGK